MSVFSTPIGIAETLLANLPVGILVYEGDTGNCVLAGQAVADLLGVSVESLRQENFQTFASRCRLAESALHDRSSGHHEAILQTAFNKIITLDIFISWFDFEGKPHVLCTVSDISESKRMQAKLEKERALLRLEQDRLAHLRFFENMDRVNRAIQGADDPETKIPMPAKVSKSFGMKSFIAMCFHPVNSKPWEFGLHQCSHARVWTIEEERLFQEIGRRLADGLGAMLAQRNLRRSLEKLEQADRTAHVGYWERDYVAETISLSKGACRIFGLVWPCRFSKEIVWRIGDLPAVSGDAAMLRMVFSNLISNALKFTRPRQHARIEISALPGEGAEATIFVRDKGVGFEMAYGDKLFGVFQRLHRFEEFEGTGIGLANVRRIIARHGGRTWAEGKPNQGATFYFMLPRSMTLKG